MKVVYKYPLELPSISSDGENVINAPWDWVIVAVGRDPTGQFCIWAEVDDTTEDEKDMVYHRLIFIGTGHKVPEYGTHMGHVVDGPFVWHLYLLD